MDELTELMVKQFPFMDAEDAETVLELCEKNRRLFYFPDSKPFSLLGYFRFFPELINVVRDQDFEMLMRCDLTKGPLVYVAVLITPGNAYKTMMRLVHILHARAYAFHRYRDQEWEFHFFRNNHYRAQAEMNHATEH